MPFGFSPWSCSQGASRMVGLGDVSCLDISVEPCQNPSRPVWEAFGTAFMMRSGSHRPGRIAFRGPPRCVAARIAARAIWRGAPAPAQGPAATPGTGGRVRRSPRRGYGPAVRAPPCAPARRARLGCAGWTIAEIVFWSQSPRLGRLDRLSPALLPLWQQRNGFAAVGLRLAR
jgi:hypothetical protein